MMPHIRELRFSVRTRNLLLNAGIETIEQLLASDLETLRKEHMFGPVTMAEIDRKIREYTQSAQVEQENEYIHGLILDALKQEEDLEVTKIPKGVAVVLPSGRHILIRIEG